MTRAALDALEGAFTATDGRCRALLDKAAQEQLFARPRDIPAYLGPFSVGEYILRSAAVVEKTFGGITTRLWDDPFEWTLPEALSSRDAVANYLNEVEATRRRGFHLFDSDEVLARQIPAPERLRSLSEVLIETVAHSEHLLGRAFAVFQMLSDDKLPRL